MSVAIEDISFRDEHTVALVISGGPVLTKKYGRRQYRVDQVVVLYQRRNSEQWKPAAVELAGPFVKKDGTDAVDSNRDHLWHRDDWGAHDWLRELVERYRPEASS